MALCQYTPDFRPQTKRMRQHLKHYISISRTVAMPAQCCQTQRMCRVVSKIKAAFEG